jgi:cell division protein ZipA
MDMWFFILGIITVIIVGAMLIWKHYNRLNRRRKIIDMAERSENDLFTDHYFDEALLDVNGKSDALFGPPETIPPQDEVSTPSVPTSEVQPLDEKTPNSPNSSKRNSSKRNNRKSEMIIALYVIAQHESSFAGTELLTVLEDLGLKYGEMNIFHHHGFGELKIQQAVFSLANMVEPGTFEPQYMSDFSTTGLALFMRLPGPFGGRVAFELMLNNAQRIVESLKGVLVDERQAPLDQKKIGLLRDRIANFEQRSMSLSMLKRFS